jgi:hypothetical protein
MRKRHDRIVEVKPVKAQEVVSMQTSTGNYIAWGYASSNCFFIGDEMPYPTVMRKYVEKTVGDVLEADIPTEQIVAELEAKFDVYYILPNMTSYYEDPEVHGHWVKLLGQNVLRLEDPNGICELIATTIGLAEGRTDLAAVPDDLKEIGTDKKVAGAVSKALATVGTGKGRDVTLPPGGTGTGLETL